MLLGQQLQQQLEQRRQQQRYRQRAIVCSPQGVFITVDGRQQLSFCSNDYLGLANHPAVVDAMITAAQEMGVGSGASHLIYGHSQQHHLLEEELAVFTGRERALLFSTGYMANMGVISALLGRGDTVFEDRLNHASLIDGGMLSHAKLQRFHHGDLSHLQHQIDTAGRGHKLVVVDGVFSMDGDLAPLTNLSTLCHRNDALLMVDDAHGFGVLGKRGGGCAEQFNLDALQLPVLVGTLGKAFGTFGAFVAGSATLIDSLIQWARTYIYTTALPSAIAAATRKSLQLVQSEHWRRQQLNDCIEQFRQGAQSLGLPLMPSFTPIQPLLLGDESSVLTADEILRQRGILVGAIRPPTVPRGQGRLRITLSANHQAEHIDQLLAALDVSVPLSVRR
jgi:8-amino-7-oxononanoate synthase